MWRTGSCASLLIGTRCPLSFHLWQLDHPNICRIIESYEDEPNNTVYIVMEMVHDIWMALLASMSMSNWGPISSGYVTALAGLTV